VAAFIAEPVVGATLGAVPPVPEYFPRIREICDRNEILFIADEVMTGFGRTGANFAVDHWGVVPDLIATAKGISGGYIPLGAVIVRDELLGAFERNRSNFVGGHTYTGHPVAAAVGLAVLRYIQEHDLVRNAREVGGHLLAGLQGLMTRHPIVGDVRGLGMMVGLEFVADRTTRAPFPPEREVARAIALECLERGLVSYPGTGSVDGVMGDHMKFTPPLVLTRAQAEAMIGEAVRTGDREFAIAALAVRSGLPADLIRKVVGERNAKGMVAITWKAGFSAKLAETLQLRLAQVNRRDILAADGANYPLAIATLEFQIDFLRNAG